MRVALFGAVFLLVLTPTAQAAPPNSYIDRVRIKYANTGRPAPTKAALVARAIQDGLIDLDDL